LTGTAGFDTFSESNSLWRIVVKRLTALTFASILLVAPPVFAGTVTLKEGGRRLFGVIISRPDSATGKAVVTVSSLSDTQVYQFDIEEVAQIESATGGVRILKAPAAVRAATSAQADVVRRFTEGMEFKIGETSDGWVSVTPAAAGLAQDKGWLPAHLLVQKMQVEAPPREEDEADIPEEGGESPAPEPSEE
jgi:hypothetical protein